jgi:hypothetical protein
MRTLAGIMHRSVQFLAPRIVSPHEVPRCLRWFANSWTNHRLWCNASLSDIDLRLIDTEDCFEIMDQRLWNSQNFTTIASLPSAFLSMFILAFVLSYSYSYIYCADIDSVPY